MENVSVKLIDLEHKIDRDTDNLVDLKREIIGVINSVQQSEYHPFRIRKEAAGHAKGKNDHRSVDVMADIAASILVKLKNKSKESSMPY